MSEHPWYESLRSQWRPDSIKLLLIGESAPDASADPGGRRFFYAPTVSRGDNLFRSVIKAIYEDRKFTKGDSKEPWLRRLRDDGIFLIDLVPYPVNKLSSAERSRALRDNVAECVASAALLSPDGIIVCHGPTFKALEAPLRAAGLQLLHTEPIPFPLGNTQARFIELVTAARRNLED